MTPIPRSFLPLLLLASLSTAQEGPFAPAKNELPSNLFSRSSWMFPIHSQADDPNGGAYGTWAVGPDYKVSFHDGFAFYPVLGPAHPVNLPIRWHGTRVRVGEHDLVGAGARATHASTPWRYEYRFEGVTEAYDVREDGVEQTFVIAKRPAAAGDLVVRGRVETELLAGPVVARHGAVVFHDRDGQPILSYGAAFAVDALGNRWSMTTGWNGSELSLTLSAASLANAVFPLTVDPLTSSVVVATGSGGLQEPEIARDDLANQICFAYSRVSSGTDYDCFVRITDDAYTASTTIFTDVTASWSTRNNQVAFVGGAADKWMVAFQRDFSTPFSGVRFITSPSGSLALVTAVNFFNVPTGTTQRYPDVGGLYSQASTGTTALLVYQRDTTTTNANTANSEVFGAVVDLGPTTPTVGTSFLLATVAAGTTYDREFPAVNQVRLSASQSWIVSWQEYNNTITSDDWDVMISRISSAGVRAGTSFLAQASATDHAITPRVEGQNGRYMGTYATNTNSGVKPQTVLGAKLECQRFDWSESSALPTVTTIRSLAAAGSTRYAVGNIAYDTNTDSHWAISYAQTSTVTGYTSIYVERCGYSGGTVEAALVYAGSSSGSGFAPSVTFNDDLNEFKIVVASNASQNPLYARTLLYNPNALNVGYGTACGTGVISANRRPHSGDEFWAATLAGAPSSVPAGLLISLGQGNLPLDALGATGCTGYVDFGAAYLLSVHRTTSTTGNAEVNVKWLDYPAAAIGDVYFQWYYFDLGGNPANVSFTRGMKVQVR